MATELPVVVIGGGQAGLAMSYLLCSRQIRHVVLERQRVGHAWRNERWDNFCLVTPNWQCQLPGHSYAGDDPHGFMGREEIVAYLESYAHAFDPPLREGVAVTRLRRTTRGFELETTDGRLEAKSVVVAIGGYHRPRIPDCANDLPSEIAQVHSRDYKSAQQLPHGAVLVVGSGQSGCQIAEDLFLEGRQVHLSVGRAPRCARRYRGRDVVDWLQDMGHYDIPGEQLPGGKPASEKTNHYVTGRDGGHDLDLRDFARRGMRLHGSLERAAHGELQFRSDLSANLDAADAVYNSINRSIDDYISRTSRTAPPHSEYVPVWTPVHESSTLPFDRLSAVVWATGFQADFGFIEAPVFDERGRALHQRGVTSVPGLHFLGLPWQHTWGSGRFCGVGRDAQYLLERLTEQI